ncbi:MAG: hypothetical protein V3W18_06740 [candidate division Zixibacteria bacterium]
MKTKVITAVFLLLAAPAIYASSEGPNDPASASGTNWKHPTYTFSSDDTRASYNNSLQDIMTITSYGFSSVLGTIDGIKIEIEGYGSSAFPPAGDQIDVALTKNGSSPAGSWKTAATLPNGISNEAYIVVGGPSDLWGTAWTPSEIQNANFGVLIRDTDAIADNLSIDHVRVTIYFTMSGSGRRLKLLKLISGD